MYRSHGTGFTADPWQRIRSSRLIAPDRPRGVKGVVTDTISTGTMSRMITESIATIDVGFPPLPRGVDRICLDSKMTDASIVAGEEFQSTLGNQALTRDPSSFKV